MLNLDEHKEKSEQTDDKIANTGETIAKKIKNLEELLESCNNKQLV